jgi:hypothetical protein
MKSIKSLVKATVLMSMAGFLMGNQGCKDTADTAAKRQLRRRVAMGGIETAPGSDVMPLPPDAGGGSFNFGFAAVGQLQQVLRETKTFSTVNNFYDPSSVGEADKKAFYECSASKPAQAFEFTNEAACMVNQPLARINARVIDFRFLRGASVDLGFSNMQFLKGISAKFDQAKLTMDFEATNPLLPGPNVNGFVIGAIGHKEYFNSVAGKVDLSFSGLGLGLGGYYRSDMAEVVKKTMEQGFLDLKAQWDEKDSEYGLAGGWYAMVIKNCDSGILINAGNTADAGLKNGDILAIYNVDYQFRGPACASQLDFMIQDKIIAYAKVVVTADTVSRAEIIENDPNYPHVDGQIKPGSRVYMKKFAPTPAQ